MRKRRDFFEESSRHTPYAVTTAASVRYVLRFTFHVQYGIILKRLSWVGDRVSKDGGVVEWLTVVFKNRKATSRFRLPSYVGERIKEVANLVG